MKMARFALSFMTALDQMCQLVSLVWGLFPLLMIPKLVVFARRSRLQSRGLFLASRVSINTAASDKTPTMANAAPPHHHGNREGRGASI